MLFSKFFPYSYQVLRECPSFVYFSKTSNLKNLFNSFTWQWKIFKHFSTCSWWKKSSWFSRKSPTAIDDNFDIDCASWCHLHFYRFSHIFFNCLVCLYRSSMEKSSSVFIKYIRIWKNGHTLRWCFKIKIWRKKILFKYSGFLTLILLYWTSTTMNVIYRLIIGLRKEHPARGFIQAAERPLVPKDPFPYVSAGVKLQN